MLINIITLLNVSLFAIILHLIKWKGKLETGKGSLNLHAPIQFTEEKPWNCLNENENEKKEFFTCYIQWILKT